MWLFSWSCSTHEISVNNVNEHDDNNDNREDNHGANDDNDHNGDDGDDGDGVHDGINITERSHRGGWISKYRDERYAIL